MDEHKGNIDRGTRLEGRFLEGRGMGSLALYSRYISGVGRSLNFLGILCDPSGGDYKGPRGHRTVRRWSCQWQNYRHSDRDEGYSSCGWGVAGSPWS